MSMLDWAEREVEIACKLERDDSQCGSDDWDYGCACYESALKAFKSLMADSHSGFSISLTKDILNKLIDGRPLTSIEDTDDIWFDTTSYGSTEYVYQCKRMSSLFKHIEKDGTVKYKDVNRCVKVDISNGSTWHNGLIDRIVSELYPITMPYSPSRNPFKVYCEDFLVDRSKGDYDTTGILYLLTPDGKRVEVNRFFTEDDNEWKEINAVEYEALKNIKL